jgi:Protein of unknown function (DUF1475).
MIIALRILFSAILAIMIGGTIWATGRLPLLSGGSALLANPWGVMTLLDAYFGFLTFFVWVAWQQRSNAARILWFALIMALGNIAMSFYVLVRLFRLPVTASMRDVLLRSEA